MNVSLNVFSSFCHHGSKFLLPSHVRCLHKMPPLLNFWEPDKKSGYKTKIMKPNAQLVKEGLKEMRGEVDKFRDEMIRKFRCDSAFPVFHGDYEIVWKFNNKEAVDSWVCTADSDHNEGKSAAGFVLGPSKKAVFCGRLNTEVPKDGINKMAGYCNIRSPKNMISFKRPRPYEWSDYTHMLMRVKGDGRTYQIVINMDRAFDLQWNDQYNYPLFTRGGPYWQIAKIPFSKFYLSAKGRVQDKQEAVQLDRVSTIGITIADSNPGPFELHIDYIGLIFDENHEDKFEYEMYEVPSYVFS